MAPAAAGGRVGRRPSIPAAATPSFVSSPSQAAPKSRSTEQRRSKDGLDDVPGALVQVFRRFDADGDGFITKTELAGVFQAVDHAYWNETRIAELMNAADTNGDGNIKYEEFVAWLEGGDREEDHWHAMALNPHRIFKKSSLIPDCRSTAGSQENFVVKFLQDCRAKLGLKVDATHNRLIIQAVIEGGLVAEWNTENSHRQVVAGDSLVGVNGLTGQALALLKELSARVPYKGSRDLELVVKPKDDAYRFVNKLEDSYDVEMCAVDEDTHYTMRFAKHRRTSQAVAVKSFTKKHGGCDVAERTISIMKELDHPNVVKLFEAFEDFNEIHLVQERCEGGELLERILEEDHFSEWRVAVVMRQVFVGVAHLRARKICHRDLRPEHVLLEERVPMERCVVKLSGFGYARAYSAANATFTTRVGPAMYRSPQMVQGLYSEACDDWNCGVMMYMLLCGFPPYAGDTEFEVNRLIEQSALIFPKGDWAGVSEVAINLCAGLLTKEPNGRMTVTSAVEHQWTKSMSPKVTDFSLTQGQRNMRSFCKQNQFKKAALHIIVQRSKPEEIIELKQMFHALDANNDSTVTFHELKEGLDRMGTKQSMESLRQMFEEIDVDGSMRIDYTEFLAATIDQRRAFEESSCWQAFRVFDRDNSGMISVKELKEVLVSDAVQSTFGALVAETVLEEVDADGDGEVSFLEFMNMMRRGNDDDPGSPQIF